MIAEDDIIARHFAPLAGPGAMSLRDDAAILQAPAGRDLVITKDMLVAGVHFFADDPPDAIARKALRVNLSDLAAKGAEPLGFLLGLALPKGIDEGWIGSFARGLGADARLHGCPLMGGDTVKTGGPLALSITAFGSVPAGAAVVRTGARPGQALLASGTIGDAALGLRIRLEPDAAWVQALPEAARAFLLDRYLHPQPRLDLRDAVLRHAAAAMDISDGLIGDAVKLGHAPHAPADRAWPVIELGLLPLSDAARAALALDATLIETIATGGDDYELLISVDPAQAEAICAAASATPAGTPLTRIGALEAGDSPRLIGPDGRPAAFTRLKFEHTF
jgi:thiamine-monophosphate kinase